MDNLTLIRVLRALKMRTGIKPLRIKNKGSRHRRVEGFTLIELLIVIIVTGILAAVAIPIAGNYINSEQAIKAVKELKSLGAAENLFYQSNTTVLGCTVAVGGTNYDESELYHIYTSNFNDLINAGVLAPGATGKNYFGQNFYLHPAYSNISINSNNYCVREAGILVYTFIPAKYAGTVNSVPGAFDIGINGSWEEIGYYDAAKENDPEQDAVLKYNW